MNHSLAAIAVYKRIMEDYTMAYNILSRHLGPRHSLLLDLHRMLNAASKEYEDAMKEHTEERNIDAIPTSIR